MSLSKAMEDLKFDKRLFEINLKMGRLTQQEIDENNKKLADLESQCEKISLEGDDSSSDQMG